MICTKDQNINVYNEKLPFIRQMDEGLDETVTHSRCRR